MNERIRTLISQYESEGSFTHVSPTPEAMARVRDELGVALPEQFLQYLEEYGHSGIGIEIRTQTACKLHGNVLNVLDGRKRQKDSARSGVFRNSEDIFKPFDFAHRA